jgi:hypothetical protein
VRENKKAVVCHPLINKAFGVSGAPGRSAETKITTAPVRIFTTCHLSPLAKMNVKSSHQKGETLKETTQTTNRRPFTTESRVRREVENAVESILDRWATGDTPAETAAYIEKLGITATHLRNEAQAIEELADEEARPALAMRPTLRPIAFGTP